MLIANDSKNHKKEKTNLFNKVRKMTNDIFHFSEHRTANSPVVERYKNEEEEVQTEANKKTIHFSMDNVN